MENVREDLQLELINLHCNSILKTKFETIEILEIFKYLENNNNYYRNNRNIFLTYYLCSVAHIYVNNYFPSFR